MYYPDETKTDDFTDPTIDHKLLLDGTVSLEDGDDETIPRVRGLVELISDYLGD